MAIKITDIGYACSICNKIYTDPIKADKCRDEHEVIYIPITRTELNRLINALNLEDISLVPPSLFDKFSKYMRTFVIKD